MVTYTSKFNMLHESAFSRYTQGAGFLAGDVVKFKPGVARSDWFKSKGSATQKLILAMADTPGNLRIGILKNEFPYAIGAHGASDNPAIMADIYVELSPANWAYPMTVPLSLLERIDTGVNHAPVPEDVKYKARIDIKGVKKGKDKANGKRTLVDDSARQLPTKNTVLPKGQKWNDTKVGGGNMPKIKLSESTNSLEDAYSLVQEGLEMPATGPTTPVEPAQHVSEGDSFNDCDYEALEDGNISVSFDDTVYSTIADDEVPVRVVAICAPTMGEDAHGWLLSTIAITDAAGKALNVDEKDTDYLSSRATDFAHKYNGDASVPVTEDDIDTMQPAIYDEAPVNAPVTIGRFAVTRDEKAVGTDRTKRITYSFDNRYTLLNFWGWELIDPAGHRIFYVNDPADANQQLKSMGFPTIEEVEDAFGSQDQAALPGIEADDELGDMSP
jgi:hypothetical protein